MRRAKRETYANGVIIDSGNTYELNKQALSDFAIYIDSLGGAWIDLQWGCMKKSAIGAAEAYLTIALNAKCVTGFSEYHYTNIDIEEIFVMNQVGHLLHNDRCYRFDKPVKVSLCFDGGPVHHIPRTYHSMSVCWLKFTAMKYGLHHSYFSACPLFFTKVSEDVPVTKV